MLCTLPQSPGPVVVEGLSVEEYLPHLKRLPRLNILDEGECVIESPHFRELSVGLIEAFPISVFGVNHTNQAVEHCFFGHFRIFVLCEMVLGEVVVHPHLDPAFLVDGDHLFAD